MPSERSLYRKMELVLEVAAEVEPGSLDELRIEIEGIPSFNTERYDAEKDDFVLGPSKPVIRRTVRWCVSLDLLSESGRLTRQGRSARRAGSFAKVVSKQVRLCLEVGGVDFAALNEAVTACMAASPAILPTARELWERLSPEIRCSDFSRLLTLLSHCGVATASQSRIYLSFVA